MGDETYFHAYTSLPYPAGIDRLVKVAAADGPVGEVRSTRGTQHVPEKYATDTRQPSGSDGSVRCKRGSVLLMLARTTSSIELTTAT